METVAIIVGLSGLLAYLELRLVPILKQRNEPDIRVVEVRQPAPIIVPTQIAPQPPSIPVEQIIQERAEPFIAGLTKRFTRQLEQLSRVAKPTVSATGSSFKCHYCKGSFPVSLVETLGGYTYCPEHGYKRQRANVSAVKPVVKLVKPAQPTELLPWEN